MIVEKTYCNNGIFVNTVIEIEDGKITVTKNNTNFAEYGKELCLRLPRHMTKGSSLVFVNENVRIVARTRIIENGLVVSDYYSVENLLDRYSVDVGYIKMEGSELNVTERYTKEV